MDIKDTTLLIDFDSTFTQVEALDVLGSIVLHGPEKEEKLAQIANITNRGMEGKLSFRQSLLERMNILSGNRTDIEVLIQNLKTKVSHSIKANKEFFTNNAGRIHIVSSGFKEFIAPVVADFGITPSHVHANTFVWDNEGNFIGFDTSNPLSNDNGKPTLVKQLNLKGKIIVIGDGYTDYEIKKAGTADLFIAYTENISRPSVIEKADFVANNFNDFLNFISYEQKTILPQA